MGRGRILVIGMNPSSYVGPSRRSLALSRLNEWMDYVGVRYFSFVNAVPTPGVARIRDVQWDVLRECVEFGYDSVIALGKLASLATRRVGGECFELPHPSGLNRKLNDAAYVERVLTECRRYVMDRSA